MRQSELCSLTLSWGLRAVNRAQGSLSVDISREIFHSEEERATLLAEIAPLTRGASKHIAPLTSPFKDVGVGPTVRRSW